MPAARTSWSPVALNESAREREREREREKEREERERERERERKREQAMCPFLFSCLFPLCYTRLQRRQPRKQSSQLLVSDEKDILPLLPFVPDSFFAMGRSVGRSVGLSVVVWTGMPN
jgi:hypothetical protein